MTRSLFLALALALTLLGVRDAAGQSAWKLSYQGVLTDDSGTLVPDGSYKLDFRLYADSIGGSARNYQSQMVPVARGVFTVLLDRPADLPFDQQWWLSVAVSGSAELAPRTRLSAAPYAPTPAATCPSAPSAPRTSRRRRWAARSSRTASP